MAVLTLSTIIEADSGDGVDGAVSGEALPAADRGVDIQRIEVPAATDPAEALSSQQCRTAAEKGIEDKIAARRTIEDRIRDQRDRFYGRVKGGEASLFALSPEVVEAWVVPDIASIPAMPAELDIVPVRRAAVLEHEDQLVLAPVQ